MIRKPHLGVLGVLAKAHPSLCRWSKRPRFPCNWPYTDSTYKRLRASSNKDSVYSRQACRRRARSSSNRALAVALAVANGMLWAGIPHPSCRAPCRVQTCVSTLGLNETRSWLGSCAEKSWVEQILSVLGQKQGAQPNYISMKYNWAEPFCPWPNKATSKYSEECFSQGCGCI